MQPRPNVGESVSKKHKHHGSGDDVSGSPQTRKSVIKKHVARLDQKQPELKRYASLNDTDSIT
jgi:hypothetical protein